MNRNRKIFAWALALYFGAVFILGFSGKLGQWEAQRYWLPDDVMFAGAVFIIMFILLAISCESFAGWFEGDTH